MNGQGSPAGKPARLGASYLGSLVPALIQQQLLGQQESPGGVTEI